MKGYNICTWKTISHWWKKWKTTTKGKDQKRYKKHKKEPKVNFRAENYNNWNEKFTGRIWRKVQEGRRKSQGNWGQYKWNDWLWGTERREMFSLRTVICVPEQSKKKGQT